MDLNLLVSLAIILLLLVIAAAVLTPRRPGEHLAHRFGPDHQRSGWRAGGHGKRASSPPRQDGRSGR